MTFLVHARERCGAPVSTYETRAVLAGAYEGGACKKHFEDKAWLSHTVEFDEDGHDVRVLCGRVKLENMADAGASTPEELTARPSCKHCEKKDPRWGEATKGSEAGMRARVAGRVDIASRIVWKLEVGAFRVRCLRQENGSTHIVQAHDGAGWNNEVTRGTDAYQLLQAVVASKGVLSFFETFVKGTARAG